MSVRRAGLALIVMAGVGGCRTEEPRERVVLKDRGDLCFGAALTDAGVAGRVEIPKGLPLPISVRTHNCLSPCARDRQARCVAKREGDRVVVSSELSYSAPEEIGKPCPGPCTVLEAQCSADALGAGTVTIAHGSRAIEIQAPSELATGCITGDVVERAAEAGAPTLAANAGAQPIVAAALTEPAPPTTGTPPTPEPTDGLCAVPYPSAEGASGAAIGVLVTRRNPCDGASCSAARPSCSLKRSGHRLVVKSDLPPPGTKPRQPCSEDCSPLLASCRAERLPAGDYVVELGARRLEVRLPLAKETCAK